MTHDVIRGDGQGRVNYEVASHALQGGLEVTLVADRIDPGLVELGARWIPVRPRRRWPQLLKVHEFARRVNRIVETVRHAADVVHANGFVLSRPHDVNTAHLVHGADRQVRSGEPRVRAMYYRAYSRFNSMWEKEAYASARCVIAVSETVRTQLEAIGVPADRVRVIRNGVDLAEFQPGPVDRRAVGLPDVTPLALFVGELRTARKNLDSVVRALVHVPQLHLAVAGDASGSSYPALAAEVGVSDRVHFLGYRDDIPDLMRAADFLAAPSRYDACPLSVLEAMASGLPVVSAVTVGTAELITSESGVVLADPEDVRVLAEALRMLANDVDRRRALGRQARRVAEEHAWSCVAERYLAVYEEFVA